MNLHVEVGLSGRQIKLGIIPSGDGANHWAWRGSDITPGSSVNVDYYREFASAAESALLDFIFLTDFSYVHPDSPPHMLNQFEPLTLLSALAASTSHIGLVGTASTSFVEPFNLARQFASLDMLSGGRAGWNLVTSGQEGAAANFGDRNHQDHDLRYVKAEEHLRVVRGLWDSWEDGAFLYDAASGAYYDRRKLHTLNHSGKFFSVRGPLNIERSQQGHPVVFQAGSSEAGRGLAASSCDVVFISSHRLDEAKKISADLRRRMEENGRNPDDLVIICGTYFMVEDSVEKAEAAYRQYAETVPIEGALKRLGGTFGHHDFSVYPLDAPFPDLEGLAANGFQSATSMVVEEAEASGLTLRQTALSYATPRSSFIGTPISVVDEIERWVAEGAADGFALFGLPDRVSLAHVARVVPELQRRGLFRRRYETATLRGHLGLAVPPNRHSRSL